MYSLQYVPKVLPSLSGSYVPPSFLYHVCYTSDCHNSIVQDLFSMSRNFLFGRADHWTQSWASSVYIFI